MTQNIRDIISLNIKLPNMTIIRGICENKQDIYGFGCILQRCKICEHLLCGRCINLQKNKCVVCETNNFKNLEKKCRKCGHTVLYFMCYYCNVILKTCDNLQCKLYDFLNIKFSRVENIGEIAICQKCK